MSKRRQLQGSRRTILVIEEAADTVASLRALLEGDGHRVLTADSAAAAVALVAREAVEVAIVGYAAAGDLVPRMRERDPLVRVIVRGRGIPSREGLRSLSIDGYHHDDDGPERLLLIVDVALETYEQLSQLRIAERSKTELLASVSHELRTPLNVIVGYIDLIREGAFGDCPPDSGAVFDKIRANAGYLLELVEEFLDFSRTEACETPVRAEVVQLAPLLRDLGDWFSVLMRARPVEFVATVASDLPSVAAEAAKVRIVVQNLLTNAAKFTETGQIRLEAERLDDARVAIRVSDTGPGIAPEHHEIIFDAFRQLRPHDPQRKGVGLGLALARRFARMMGGDVTVESVVGRGSTFTVVLPTGPPRAAPGSAAA
jgi:signal transduction histidine kinase